MLLKKSLTYCLSLLESSQLKKTSGLIELVKRLLWSQSFSILKLYKSSLEISQIHKSNCQLSENTRRVRILLNCLSKVIHSFRETFCLQTEITQSPKCSNIFSIILKSLLIILSSLVILFFRRVLMSSKTISI